MNIMNLFMSLFQKAQIPNGMKDPDQIINYLLQNGKITQQQYNQARMQMQQMAKNGTLPPCPY